MNDILKPLTERRKVWPWIVGGVAAVALTLGSLGATALVNPPTPEPTDFEIGDVVESPTPDVTPTEEPTTPPVVEPAAPAPDPVEAPPAAPPAPVKCPAGTVPGAVDDAGNESACQQSCSAWEDRDGDGTAEFCVPYALGNEGTETFA